METSEVLKLSSVSNSCPQEDLDSTFTELPRTLIFGAKEKKATTNFHFHREWERDTRHYKQDKIVACRVDKRDTLDKWWWWW